MDSIEPIAHTSLNIASKSISTKKFEKIKTDVRKLSLGDGNALDIAAKAERLFYVFEGSYIEPRQGLLSI